MKATQQHVLEIFEAATLAAGRAIMEVMRAGPTASFKPDQSPVTEADIRAERIILDRLGAALPGIPVIAEEAVAAGKIPDISGRRFILVDPLDGTKEFVKGASDFTVNIALVEDGRPVAGVVYAPALGLAYSGAGNRAEKLTINADFAVADRRSIATRSRPPEPIAVASRSHRTQETDGFLRENRLDTCTNIGSSLKFCLLAEGTADIYPRFGRAMQWDTAAGDAVLRAAGGITIGPDGKPLTYGRTALFDTDAFANPNFIAFGRHTEPSQG